MVRGELRGGGYNRDHAAHDFGKAEKREEEWDDGGWRNDKLEK